jgi:hypothetical protein
MNLKHQRQRQKQRTKFIIYLREGIFKYRKMPNCRSRLSMFGTFQCFPATFEKYFFLPKRWSSHHFNKSFQGRDRVPDPLIQLYDRLLFSIDRPSKTWGKSLYDDK